MIKYIVTLNKPIKEEFIKKMSNGILNFGRTTKKCFVKKIDNKKFKIILTEGLNRQIRRMCEYLNYKVIKLKRIRIMNINLDLDVGKYRFLSNTELKKLNELTKTLLKNLINFYFNYFTLIRPNIKNRLVLKN